ncbi:OsmC family protein [Alkalihalobacterium chitinilyticum]|uniref:OsmC family protein n=1 Tax=Alkalihalobacterium chitinilyticum TaxID=2980103 RepID=A0ABT5VHW8_9BACI|nr:OsmC family protein [Alkalihalobacterium chitinilyticum]MDE5414342.1 OsmC family protein [Alkalihalobacterium chitinilyticum]
MNNINVKALEQTVEAIKKDPTLKMRNWAAQVKWENGVKNLVKIRDFENIVMDEPETLGGTDEGPNPVEMLIGSAASCFAITFEVLASQNGITIEAVTVDIEAGLNAAVFLGLEEGDGGITNPVITLKAETSAPKEIVEEIAKVAFVKSPVLASLSTEIHVKVV